VPVVDVVTVLTATWSSQCYPDLDTYRLLHRAYVCHACRRH